MKSCHCCGWARGGYLWWMFLSVQSVFAFTSASLPLPAKVTVTALSACMFLGKGPVLATGSLGAIHAF